jgi:hypothetical protein
LDDDVLVEVEVAEGGHDQQNHDHAQRQHVRLRTATSGRQHTTRAAYDTHGSTRHARPHVSSHTTRDTRHVRRRRG